MKKIGTYMALTIAVVSLSIIMAQAQAIKNQASVALRTRDQAFVTAANQGGVAEVELGKLAEGKAYNPSVKEFAQRMVKDHTTVNDNLKETAAKISVNLPNALNSKDKEELANLSKLSGATFDKAYMRDMIRNHRMDIVAFRHEAIRGHNEVLRSFASITLPTLRTHLRLAERTYSKLESPKAS